LAKTFGASHSRNGIGMTDSEMLKEAERILCAARRAIGKILVERERGMGYFHAEVDWLINERDSINKLIDAIRATGESK
jgi:hypothetical protein